MSRDPVGEWFLWVLGLTVLAVLAIVGLGVVGVFERLGDASGFVGLGLGVAVLLGAAGIVARRHP